MKWIELEIHNDIMNAKPHWLSEYIAWFEENKQIKKYFSGKKKNIIRKKSDFLWKWKWVFTFDCWESELTEDQQDYLAEIWKENYKNKKF